MRRLSEIFDHIEANIEGDSISVARLLDVFHERGFGVLLFLFALPAALPLPAVGVGTILGLPLVFLTAQQAIGSRTIWLPKSVQSKSFSRDFMTAFVSKATSWVERIEMIVKPRLAFVTSGFFSNFIGVAGFIMALSVCVPLPFTNTVPSLGIALMAVGVLMRDGLAVLAGLVIGMAWVSMLVYFTIFFGTEGVLIAKEFIKGFF